MSIFDDKIIQLTCPQCGHQFDERIGRLKDDPSIPCAGCGATIQIEAERLRQGLESVDKQLADFKRSLRNLSK